MGLLFGSAGAHTYLKSGQVAPPPPRLDPTYSYLAGTSLTVITLKVKRSNVLKYPSDYLIQPPSKSIHYDQYWNNPCSAKSEKSGKRGTWNRGRYQVA